MTSLKSNIIYNFIYQFLILFLPLVTAPYLARTLGADGVGKYSFAYSVALYFTYFILLGLTKYGNRSIALVQEDREERSVVFCEIYLLQLICSVICLAVYAAYVIFVAKDRLSAFCMGLFVLSAMFDINWFFFGMELFKITVTRNILIKIIVIFLIFMFVKEPKDIYIYILIMSTGYLFTQLSLWFFVRRYVDFKKVKLSAVKKHILPDLMLFIPVIAVSVYKVMDKIMLGIMTNNVELGYYENAEKIINVPIALITAVGTVMLPRMSAMLSKNKNQESLKYIDITMITILAFVNAATLGIIVVGKNFSVIFYGKEFIKSGQIMTYLAVTIVFLGVGNVIRTQYLIPMQMDKIYIISAILGAVINFGINLALIGKYKSIGAAVGTICAEFGVCAYQMYGVRKCIDLKKYIWYEAVFLAFSLLMFAVINGLSYIASGVSLLFLQIIVGIIVYSSLCAFYLIKIKKIDINI